MSNRSASSGDAIQELQNSAPTTVDARYDIHSNWYMFHAIRVKSTANQMILLGGNGFPRIFEKEAMNRS